MSVFSPAAPGRREPLWSGMQSRTDSNAFVGAPLSGRGPAALDLLMAEYDGGQHAWVVTTLSGEATKGLPPWGPGRLNYAENQFFRGARGTDVSPTHLSGRLGVSVPASSNGLIIRISSDAAPISGPHLTP